MLYGTWLARTVHPGMATNPPPEQDRPKKTYVNCSSWQHRFSLAGKPASRSFNCLQIFKQITKRVLVQTETPRCPNRLTDYNRDWSKVSHSLSNIYNHHHGSLSTGSWAFSQQNQQPVPWLRTDLCSYYQDMLVFRRKGWQFSLRKEEHLVETICFNGNRNFRTSLLSDRPSPPLAVLY